MNKTVVMILGGAVLVAVIVALLVQAKLSPKQGSAQPTSAILVAAKKLEVGTQLKAEHVSWKAVPEDAVFPGAIRKSSEPDLKNLSVYGSPLRRAVEAGEPITRQSLIADVKASGNYMAASLMPGMRAMTVSVKADSGLGGFVSPGDRVDVILVYSPRFSSANRAAGEVLVARSGAQTLISNVRVMGVDQISSETNRQVKVPKTVTLEVSREQAERLALARDIGKITLALRRLGEQDTAENVTSPITTDITATEIQRKVSDAVRRSKAVGDTVRVYSGSDVKNVPVRAGLSPDAAPQP